MLKTLELSTEIVILTYCIVADFDVIVLVCLFSVNLAGRKLIYIYRILHKPTDIYVHYYAPVL